MWQILFSEKYSQTHIKTGLLETMKQKGELHIYLQMFVIQSYKHNINLATDHKQLIWIEPNMQRNNLGYLELEKQWLKCIY